MPMIRPISDLRNNFADISKIVHGSYEPIFLTKNGHGEMVVMSVETYENLLATSEIHAKLTEAGKQARTSDNRISHQEVMDEGRKIIKSKGVIDEKGSIP